MLQHHIKLRHGRHRRQHGGSYLPGSFVPDTDEPERGNWGPWSTPSSCSRSCGGGVAHQTRQCLDIEWVLIFYPLSHLSTYPNYRLRWNVCSLVYREIRYWEECRTRRRDGLLGTYKENVSISLSWNSPWKKVETTASDVKNIANFFKDSFIYL